MLLLLIARASVVLSSAFSVKLHVVMTVQYTYIMYRPLFTGEHKGAWNMTQWF